jgi:hypothetical protein
VAVWTDPPKSSPLLWKFHIDYHHQRSYPTSYSPPKEKENTKQNEKIAKSKPQKYKTT